VKNGVHGLPLNPVKVPKGSQASWNEGGRTPRGPAIDGRRWKTGERARASPPPPNLGILAPQSTSLPVSARRCDMDLPEIHVPWRKRLAHVRLHIPILLRYYAWPLEVEQSPF
jgi:hypothetical protein